MFVNITFFSNFLNYLDNFPPNVTSVVELSETDALQEGEVSLYASGRDRYLGDFCTRP